MVALEAINTRWLCAAISGMHSRANDQQSRPPPAPAPHAASPAVPARRDDSRLAQRSGDRTIHFADRTRAPAIADCRVELSVGRPQKWKSPHGNVHQVDRVPNGPTNTAAITTMSPLRLCGGKLLVAVTRERRYGPNRLRVNDDYG